MSSQVLGSCPQSCPSRRTRKGCTTYPLRPHTCSHCRSHAWQRPVLQMRTLRLESARKHERSCTSQRARTALRSWPVIVDSRLCSTLFRSLVCIPSKQQANCCNDLRDKDIPIRAFAVCQSLQYRNACNEQHSDRCSRCLPVSD